MLGDVFEQIEQIMSQYPAIFFYLLKIVKKFSGLRIFWQRDGAPSEAVDKIVQIIKKADTLSFTTSEICGASAALGLHSHMYMVRCTSCEPEQWKPVDENLSRLIEYG